MSIFSPCSSFTTACTRLPRMPTQAPTGSIEASRDTTAILARLPGIARHRLDRDDAVVDLRHFLREQLGHEFRMGARQEDLRPALLAAHVVDIGADAVAIAEILARQRFVAAHDGLGAAEIDDHVAVFDALDDAVDDLADAVLVLVVLALALGLAHLLHDHLLGVLRRDAAEIERRQRLGDEVADLGGRVLAARLGERDLRRLQGHVLDHFQEPRQRDFAGLRVDLGLDLVLAAIAGLRRLLDRVLHGGDDDLAVDRLFARDRVGDLQELQPVGADACLRHSSASKLKLRSLRGRSDMASRGNSMYGRLPARKIAAQSRRGRWHSFASLMSEKGRPIITGSAFSSSSIFKCTSSSTTSSIGP